MKKSIIAGLVSALFAIAGIAPAMATDGSAVGVGGASIGNVIKGTVGLGATGGFSQSGAFNNEAAKITMTPSSSFTPVTGGITETAGFTGSTATQSSAGAYNQSSNGGVGTAASYGGAKGQVSGGIAINGLSQSNPAQGNAGAGTTNNISVGTNQAGSVQQYSGSDISLGLSQTKTSGTGPDGQGVGTTITNTISDSKSGDAFVSSVSQQGFIQNPDGSTAFAGQGLGSAKQIVTGGGAFNASINATTGTLTNIAGDVPLGLQNQVNTNYNNLSAGSTLTDASNAGQIAK